MSLPPAPEIALVKLNLSGKSASFQLRHMVDRYAQFMIHSGYRLVTEVKIIGQSIGRLRLVESFYYSKLSAELFETFLTFALPTLYVPATSAINLVRTAKNALPAPQKVGRTTENVLLPLCHMDILVPHGYDYH